MKKVFIIIATALLMSISAKAQPYNWAIGLRGGLSWGNLTVKHFVGNNSALEFDGAISFNDWGWELSGLYELNTALSDGLNFYYGPGAHFGFFPDNDKQVLALGVLGVAGLEYKFKAPIAISLDWRPHLTLNLGNNGGLGFGLADVGLGLKFCF